MVAEAIADLKRLGAIEGSEVETVLPVLIDCAYVIYDHSASAVKAQLHAELAAATSTSPAATPPGSTRRWRTRSSTG